MNSILQCIFATAPLTKFFNEEYPSHKKLRNTKIADSYASLLEDARRAKGSAIVPRSLKNDISRVAPQFTGYGQ